ncbi:MAG TPA: alpha/beta fold hydrolase [Anaerolineae bacterium]|nr:alpha/beta fold hydrolase [Anaerolineae bacterium]
MALTVSILLAACDVIQPTATPGPTLNPNNVPRFESAECWFDDPMGQTPECGYLVVPEDRSQPSAKTIQLAVARFTSSGSDPAPDPIIYLEGGPGGSPLRTLVSQFSILFGPLLETRDVILLDQRGTGYSQPALDCPEYREAQLDLLDQNLSAEQAEQAGNQALLECRNRLAGSGVNLAAYNSAESAADLEDLRQVLGIERWNLYGISYGTRLALTALRDSPDGIRSVVIDSVLPLQVDLYSETPASGARAFDTLFEACAADAECNAAFPDLREVFFALAAQLDQQPVTFPIRLPSGEQTDLLLNGDGLVAIVFQSLYGTSLIPLLPRLIYEVRDGNYALAGALQSAFLTQLEDISAGMQYSVQCTEEAPFNSPDQVGQAAEQYPEYKILASKGIFGLCQNWGARPAAPVEDQPVMSDIPTLVLGGGFDPITPPSWAQLAAQTLSNSFYFEFPTAGHGSSLTEECPRSLVLAFLEDPTTQPDAACIAGQMAQVDFAEPVAEIQVQLAPFTEAELGFSGVFPEGWQKIAPGSYTPTGSLTDQTGIVHQAGPFPAEGILNLLTTQLEQGGTNVSFEQIETRAANELEWSIYTAEASIAVFDIALAEGGGGITYLILLQSVVDERDALYRALFLPAVDALKPTGQ